MGLRAAQGADGGDGHAGSKTCRSPQATQRPQHIYTWNHRQAQCGYCLFAQRQGRHQLSRDRRDADDLYVPSDPFWSDGRYRGRVPLKSDWVMLLSAHQQMTILE